MHEKAQHVVLHYGELSLKGRNRPAFLRTLSRNLQHALCDLGPLEISKHPGRLVLALPASVPGAQLEERLKDVFGVANFARCETVPHDLGAIKHAVSRLLAGRSFRSFRITSRRAFKELPWNSLTLNAVLGTHVLEQHDTCVDLDHPELTIHVEVIPRVALVYLDKIPGAGGLPVDSGGTVLSLLSGGIDSPVAAYRMMRRGCHVDWVHFHSYPFLDRTSQDKARYLAQMLTRFQYSGRLFLVPFGEVQQQIVGSTPPSFRVVLYRRYMLRLACALARQLKALALVTGESLGQVASQTLTNLGVIEGASDLPVLRPLIGLDKMEIIEEARRIGTYATSIQPDQDCCTLFVPRHPATHTVLADIEAAEKTLDMPALLQLALAGVQTVDLSFHPVTAAASGKATGYV